MEQAARGKPVLEAVTAWHAGYSEEVGDCGSLCAHADSQRGAGHGEAWPEGWQVCPQAGHFQRGQEAPSALLPPCYQDPLFVESCKSSLARFQLEMAHYCCPWRSCQHRSGWIVLEGFGEPNAESLFCRATL